MLDDFMTKLSKDMELEEPITSDVPGTYVLPLEEKLSVTFQETDDGLTMQSNICEIPEAKAEEFLTDAMFGNLFGQGTEGAILGLDPSGKILTLTTSLSHGTEYAHFYHTLEDFINTVDFWADEVKSYK